MIQKYPKALEPLKIGNVVLKNHMLSSVCLPHFLMGPEKFPAESVIKFMEDLAKAGASLVTLREQNDNMRGIPADDVRRWPWFDITDPSVENYFAQACEAVHFQGALASIFIKISQPRGYDVSPSGGTMHLNGGEPGAPKMEFKEITEELLDDMVQEAATKARFYKRIGFDACVLHMAYTAPMMARFISPVTNHRTDKFGGSLENRARFPLAVLRAVREACGPDFLIEIELTAEETAPGGMKVEDTIEFAKMCEGVVDIFQLRLDNIDPAHPVGYSYDGVPPTLRFAEAFKKAGVKGVVAPNGGFQDIGMIEDCLASGKCDAVSMARTFIADPDFIKKVAEDRAEDVVPCIRCNKCHYFADNGWLTICSVNPKFGLSHRMASMISPPDGACRSVAVIGGGPAGMRAALYASERGHKVTIFEKSSVLGGQLLHADYASFKWPLKNFKDYLIAQVAKDSSIELRLNTLATPAMIEAEGFDAVITAVGAEPNKAPIAGADSTKYYSPISVFGHEAELGRRVVVVGGSETGVDTGMYLAECGHDVTVLTRQDGLAHDSRRVHYWTLVRKKWESYPNFKSVLEAVTTSVADGKVTYRTKDGEEKTIECDSIVLSCGVHALKDEAAAFYGSARQVYSAGDCCEARNVQFCNRTALAAASKI